MRADKFVLVGTECFHRVCAADAYRSKLRRLEVDLEASRTRQQELHHRLTQVESAASRADTDRRAAQISHAGQLAALRAELELERQRLAGARGELAQARNETLLLRQRTPGATVAPTPIVVAVDDNADEDEKATDAGVERFKMLELD